MINILLSGGLSLIFALIGTPLLIRFLTRRQYGQFIREDGPTAHYVKRGTPTMGGLVIVGAVLAAYAVTHLVRWQAPSLSGVLLLGLTVGMAFLGFLIAMLTYQLADTHDHRYLFPMSWLIGYVVLTGAYFTLKHIFYAQGAVGIIIEVVGGAFFLIYLLRKGRL